MGKLVPGAVSLPFLTLRKGKGIISPLLPKFPLEEVGEFLKISYLVETTSPTSPPLASAPFQPLHSRVHIQNCVCFEGLRVVRGGQGGQSQRVRGIGHSQQSQGNRAFLPSTLHRLSGSTGHPPSQRGSKLAQSASELRGFRQGRPQR